MKSSRLPRASTFSVLTALLACYGCSKAADQFDGSTAPARPAKIARQPTPAAATVAADAAPAEATIGPVTGGEADQGVARKIIYTADVQLACDDFSTVSERLESLTTNAGGFIAEAQTSGNSGQPRWGQWKLRVPIGRFDGLLAEIKKLAEVESVRVTSDDVSEEFYDVDARIHNKQQEESRLLRLLDERTAKLNDVLSVEREVSRVRGEIEQLQARLRVLSNLTELATISVRLNEVRGYQPETAATFGVRLTRGVEQSLAALLGATQSMLIAAAIVLPWLVTVGVPLWVAAALIRRARRLHAART